MKTVTTERVLSRIDHGDAFRAFAFSLIDEQGENAKLIDLAVGQLDTDYPLSLI
jgi:hypothetical protein